MAHISGGLRYQHATAERDTAIAQALSDLARRTPDLKLGPNE